MCNRNVWTRHLNPHQLTHVFIDSDLNVRPGWTRPLRHGHTVSLHHHVREICQTVDTFILEHHNSSKRLVQSHSSNNNWKSRIKPNGSNCDSETSRYVTVVTLTIICPTLCRRFFHKGCVVVFFSVTAVKSLTYNVMLQIKITDLSVGSGNEVNSRFLAGWPAFEKPANFGGKATLA